MPDTVPLSTADKIAAEGERIYAESYKADYEERFPGQYLAVDIDTGKAYRAEFPEQALSTARQQAPSGIFHLIRIGSPGAFKISNRRRRHEASYGRALRRAG